MNELVLAKLFILWCTFRSFPDLLQHKMEILMKVSETFCVKPLISNYMYFHVHVWLGGVWLNLYGDRIGVGGPVLEVGRLLASSWGLVGYPSLY